MLQWRCLVIYIHFLIFKAEDWGCILSPVAYTGQKGPGGGGLGGGRRFTDRASFCRELIHHFITNW